MAAMEVDHALVIGGTGMLRRATVTIGAHSRRLTAVARTATSLAALKSLLPDRESDRYQTLDWNQPEKFVLALQRLVDEVGPPRLVLAWMHDLNLGPPVALTVSASNTHCDFFQVIGSSGGRPGGVAKTLRKKMEGVRHVSYFQVVLGFKEQAGLSRWLSNDEISAGVLDAIKMREGCHIIGTVTPWDQRP